MADFNSLFSKNKTEKTSHGSYKITWIHYSKLRESDYQYCPGTPKEIETLADRIAGDGKILQNLIVRKAGEDSYEIIAGHKRCAAVKMLVEDRGLEKYAMVPCLVATENEAKTRFAVISSNTHHEKTPYEIMHELKELEYLIKTYPDEFPDLQTGRMVDRLAKQTGMAKSVVGEYQSIAKNLSSIAMEKFEKSEIDKSAASSLAGLPADEQDKLLASGITQNKDIKKYKKEKKERQEAQKQNHPTEPEKVIKNRIEDRYEMEYTQCIFNGIKAMLDQEINNGVADRRREMSYIVERYCREEIISGAVLREKLDEYIQMASERYGGEDGDGSEASGHKTVKASAGMHGSDG